MPPDLNPMSRKPNEFMSSGEVARIPGTSSGKNGPIRVLHVAVSLEKSRGGTAQAPLSLCRALREHGVDAQIASALSAETAETSLARSYPDIPVHEFPTSFPRRFTGSAGLRKWLASEVGKFDLVEIHEIFAFPPLLGRLACNRAKVPYLLNIHNALNPRDLQKRRWLKWIFRRPFLIPLIRDARGLKATSQYEVDTMVEYVRPPEIHTLPLPVECPMGGGNPNAFRQRFNIPSDAIVVGCVGRLDGQKALEVLIESFGRILKDYPKAWLLLVGRGTPEYTERLQQLADQHQARARCTFTGFLSGVDKSSAFLAIDLYAQVSWYENFCISVAEAMAMGRPCLVSDQVGLASDVLAAGGGFICKTSVTNVVTGLRTALDTRSTWAELGDRARNYFLRNLTIAATTPKLIEIYRKIIQEG